MKDKKGEIRQDKATRQWVIFAPARGKKPRDFKRPMEEKPAIPSYDADCPFCPGNEDMLPPVILEMASRFGGPPQTRVVPNKFPALTPDGDSLRRRAGIYTAMEGYGRHEVIIESPRHDRQIHLMSVEEVETVIRTYHRRYAELMESHGSLMTIIFRNHGRRAGTSLSHPHSQLIVTPMVPHHIRWREYEAQRYFDQWGRCVYCDILEFEIKEGRRVILENDSFVAFIPYAAQVPFETWIVPRHHQADFGRISEGEGRHLAAALLGVLSAMDRKLGDPDYNYVINTSAQYRAGEPQLHWYFQIRPRMTTQAGFEIGSGISINPSLPEDDAAFLRE